MGLTKGSGKSAREGPSSKQSLIPTDPGSLTPTPATGRHFETRVFLTAAHLLARSPPEGAFVLELVVKVEAAEAEVMWRVVKGHLHV